MLIDNGPTSAPLPGQVRGDVPAHVIAQLRATPTKRGYAQACDEDLRAKWIDLDDPIVDAPTWTIWEARTVAASLDPRFGCWTWSAWVDGDRAVALENLTWVERIPDAWAWNQRLTDLELLQLQVEELRDRMIDDLLRATRVEWLLEHPWAIALAGALLIVALIVDAVVR